MAEKTKSSVMIFVLAAAIIFGIALLYKVSHRKDEREKLDKLFHTVLLKTDNIFSAESSELDGTNGVTTYRFLFHGEEKDFAGCFTELCGSLENDFPLYDLYENGYIIMYAKNKAQGTYISYIHGPSGRAETNMYLDDYYEFENLDGIKYLVIDTRHFTDDQKSSINSVRDKYSFRIETKNILKKE